ncbi:hypothetical protein [Brachyspira pilosicoli]|uniref:hypothetical protein n=1 Tax=Brachyspira pilosicoli TaxID=52584 RepID=UPI003004669A
MEELVKISNLVSILLNAQVKEMSKVAPTISNILLQSINLDLLERLSYLISNTVSHSMELHKNEYNVVNGFYEAFKQSEELYKKEYKKIMGFNVINSFHDALKQSEELYKKEYEKNIASLTSVNNLYEVCKGIEELHKENNYILNCGTYTKNYEEIIYQTNVNIENIHNDNNICNYKEFAVDLCFLVKDFIISKMPKRLLIILNKYKDNPIFLFIIIVVFSSIVLFTFTIENTLKELILVKSSEDTKTIIINQHINNITIINDNKPYYYYIETKDENGNIINGYVSKRKYNKLKSNKTVEK